MLGAPIDVKDAAGVTQTIHTIPNPGQAANAASQPVTLSTEQQALLASLDAKLPALDNGRQPTLNGNCRDKWRDPFTSKDPAKWTYPTESGSQYARSRIDGNVAGASYLVVSLSALVAGNNEWEAISVDSFQVPYEIEYGMTLSQRVLGQEINIEMVGVDGGGAVLEESEPAPVALTGTVSVTTNVWTFTTTVAHNLRPGDWVCLYGATDSRLNVGAVICGSGTVGTTIVFTSTLANGTYTLGGAAFVQRIMLTAGALTQAGTRWYGATAGNADIISRNSDPRGRCENWNPGNTQDTAIVPNEGGLNYAAANYVQPLRTKGSWHLEHTSKRVTWRARDIDGTGNDRSQRLRREPNPSFENPYKMRLRAKNLPNFSVPTGSITVAAKSGTTTATLTIPGHGLTTSDFIVVYGIRDQTNFANLTTATAVASVVDANNITIAFGASATATSYGGFVMKVQGGGIPNIQAISVQTYQKTADGLRLLLVGSGTWTETIGHTVTLFGLTDSTNTVISALHGRYRLTFLSTTTIELEPLDGQDLTSVSTSPVNAGGTLIRNTDLRIHYFRVFDRLRQEVDMTMGGSAIEPMPVQAVGTTVVSGTGNFTVVGAADDSAAKSGNPALIGGRIRTAVQTDYADGDVANLRCDQNGRLIISDIAADKGLTWNFAMTGFSATADTPAAAAAGASIRRTLGKGFLRNTSATPGFLILKSATTELVRIPMPASMTVPINIDVSGYFRTAANAAFNVACSVASMSLDGHLAGYNEF